MISIGHHYSMKPAGETAFDYATKGDNDSVCMVLFDLKCPTWVPDLLGNDCLSDAFFESFRFLSFLKADFLLVLGLLP